MNYGIAIKNTDIPSGPRNRQDTVEFYIMNTE